VLGRKVAELENATKEAGYHVTRWNADGVASGVYFARFTAGDQNGSEKLSKVSNEEQQACCATDNKRLALFVPSPAGAIENLSFPSNYLFLQNEGHPARRDRTNMEKISPSGREIELEQH
jgi:hypothetical protein